APLLAAVRKLPLPPSGMTITISRITTGAEVEAQASENAAVQETDIDDTALNVNVRTYAGQQDVSRQALERSEMVDAVVFQDLVADYWTKLDSAIINGAGTSGTHLGIRSTSGIISVTYTDGTPTVGELYPKLADAIQQIASQRYAPATTIVMHPRRWGWITASLDSQNRPLAVPQPAGPFNALAVGDAPEYGAVVGSIHGLPVITDANIPTNLGAGSNEDVILVLRVPDLLFWQEGDGAPRQLRFEETLAGNLTVKLVVAGYSAFTAGRYPKASAVIGGTGLVAPTF
ncbi:MAG: phage major capsid protein, partial [Gaiellaceae bacterium]|nr:phage major capsid protein [Gaiellaceae bacterium]